MHIGEIAKEWLFKQQEKNMENLNEKIEMEVTKEVIQTLQFMDFTGMSAEAIIMFHHLKKISTSESNAHGILVFEIDLNDEKSLPMCYEQALKGLLELYQKDCVYPSFTKVIGAFQPKECFLNEIELANMSNHENKEK